MSIPHGSQMHEQGNNDSTELLLWRKIEELSSEHAARPALLENPQATITYGQLSSQMDQLTHVLQEAQIPVGAIVAVVLPEGPGFLAAILAISKLWGCAPLNPSLTPHEMEESISALAPAAILIAQEFPEALETSRHMGLLRLQRKFSFHSEEPTEWTWLDPVSSRSGEVATSDAAILLHTSATTGRSKLVPLSRGNLGASMRSTQKALQLTEGDRVLLLSPLFHLQAILSAMSQLALGGSVVTPRTLQADAITGHIRDAQPTWYTCGPTMHGAICSTLDESEAWRTAGKTLRFVRSIGAPLSPALAQEIQRVLGVPVLNGYGLTETGAVTTLFADDAEKRVGSVGKALDLQIGIRAADGQVLPEGHEGEVVLRGPCVMSGYRNDPQANAAAFRGGWFHTGDLGRLDGDGFLYLTGRLKEIINRGGEKIHPAEVDEALLLHPAVAQAAAFSIPHSGLGEDVAAAVVLRPGTSARASALQIFVAQRLASFKTPRHIFFVDEIPRGATGKPQRHLLSERFADASFPKEASAPESPKAANLSAIEEPLLQLWTKLLGNDPLDAGTDFFDAGGDSIRAVAMLSEAQKLFRLPAPLSAESFYYQATITHLAAMIQAEELQRSPTMASTRIRVLPLSVRTRILEQPRAMAEALSPCPLPALFLIPADGTEGTAMRWLSDALENAAGVPWSTSLVRPESYTYARSATTLEDAGRAATDAILSTQPTIPFLIAGYCFGGVVAFEAARRLQRHGCVGLVLFDTPVPGYPQKFLGQRDVLRRLQQSIFALRTQPGWARKWGEVFVRKVIWNAVLRLRPVRSPLWERQPLRSLANWAMARDLPYFRLRPIDIPVLHVMARATKDPLFEQALSAWDQVACAGITTRELPCTHHSLFSGPNVSIVAQEIYAWTLRLLPEEAGPSGK